MSEALTIITSAAGGALLQFVVFMASVGSRLTRIETKLDALTSDEGHNLLKRVAALERNDAKRQGRERVQV